MKKKIFKMFTAILVFALVNGSAVGSVHAIDNMSYTDMQTEEIIAILNASENGIPQNVTQEDIQRVIEFGGEKGLQALEHIYEVTEPAPLPPLVGISDELEQNDSKTRYTCQYNMKTGEEVYINEEKFNTPSNSSVEIMNLNNGVTSDLQTRTTMLRGYPYSWTVEDPQNYAEHRATCKLLIQTQTGTYHGTGFMVSNTDLVTVGHNLWGGTAYGGSGWPIYVTVIPSVSETYPGGCYGTYGDTTTIEVGSSFKNNGTLSDDWGMMHLTESPGCGYYTPLTGSQVGWWVRGQGYYQNTSQLYAFGGNITSQQEKLMVIGAQGYQGMSGGPVMDDTQLKVVGIIIGTYNNSLTSTYAVRVDNWLYNKIMSYR